MQKGKFKGKYSIMINENRPLVIWIMQSYIYIARD